MTTGQLKPLSGEGILGASPRVGSAAQANKRKTKEEGRRIAPLCLGSLHR